MYSAFSFSFADNNNSSTDEYIKSCTMDVCVCVCSIVIIISDAIVWLAQLRYTEMINDGIFLGNIAFCFVHFEFFLYFGGTVVCVQLLRYVSGGNFSSRKLASFFPKLSCTIFIKLKSDRVRKEVNLVKFDGTSSY